MCNKIITILLLIVIILIFSSNVIIAISNEEDEIVTNTIQDNNDVLLNPGKGFVYYASRLTYDDEHEHFFNWVSQDMLDSYLYKI